MNYTKEQIISVLEFVEEKVTQYLKVINDDNLDHWRLGLTNEGKQVISINTSSYLYGDTDHRYYNVTFEKLLTTTEEQVRIIESERKAEIERERQLEAKRQIQRDLERQQRDYEEYLRLKSKYEK